MKNRALLALALVPLYLRLLFPSAADVTGLHYENRKTAGPESIHILEVNPRLLRIEAVRALDDGVGRETVQSIAQRKAAIAAVNAGFFRIGGRYDGEPEGILKIRESWFSDPGEARGAIGWNGGGEIARIGRLTMRWVLQSRGKTFPVDGINRPRGSAEAILYDWAFHRSTLTDPGGIEFAIARNKISGSSGRGNAAIPQDGFVYSLGPKSPVSGADLKIKAPVKITWAITDTSAPAPGFKPDWREMEYIVGGMPALFLKQHDLLEHNEEKMRAGFDTERHPRTAVGVRADGIWVFVVVDGRQPELSVGMNLKELSGLLSSLGCIDALNLDGGGSSTLYFDGKVVNSPSDATKDRPVSDAIVILRK
jgi:hypothetical protein